MANNTGRRIEIALVGNDTSLDAVTISPHATDTNKLANSGLASMTLLEPGQSVILQQSDNSDRWEVVSQGVATYGSAPTYACRAWVNFNGTGTVAIRASGNVSSITDNAVGDYTVNFTTAMEDENYSTSGNVASDTHKPTLGYIHSTTQLGVHTGITKISYNEDISIIEVQVFR